MTAYLRPNTLPEAIAGLAGRDMRVLAGGTDVYPATQGPMLTGPVMDLSGLPELRGISRVDGGLRIGACTTWSEILQADLPPALRALQEAANEVGGWQIQTAGTIGGNLCNASPAADGVPPLLAVGAQVDLAGPGGMRRLALDAFIAGPRRTALRPGEILAGVVIPDAGLAGRSRFLKLGARAHLVISIVMVAVRLVVAAGRVADVALVVGSASPVARRLPLVEAAIRGVPLDRAAGRIEAAMVAAALAPIDDVRASAAYRAEAAATLLQRAVAALVKEVA